MSRFDQLRHPGRGGRLTLCERLSQQLMWIPADSSGRCPDLGAAHPFRDQDEANGRAPVKQLIFRSGGECEPRSPLAR